MLEKFSGPAHFVEIGSYKGRSSSYMAVEIVNSGKSITFDCVDTWKGSEEHQQGQSFEDLDAYKTGDWHLLLWRFQIIISLSC